MGKEHNWSLYFQCGYKGAFDHLNPEVWFLIVFSLSLES